MKRYYIENYFDGDVILKGYYTMYFNTFKSANNYLNEKISKFDNFNDWYIVCEKDNIITSLEL